jgi:hypothetical protein
LRRETVSRVAEMMNFVTASGCVLLTHQQDPDSRSGFIPAVDWNEAIWIVRYIGHTANSARASSLLASILEELKLKLNIPMDLPPDSKTMTEEFSAWLKMSTAIKPVVIVLDGLDQLEVADRVNLFWLPASYPSRCRMYVSAAAQYLLATPSKKLERALRYTIRPLTDVYCTMMIDEFLGQYGKTLDSKQKDRLLACPRTRNPFYLFVVLEEIRFFGSFERLRERFEYYLNTADVTELFDKVWLAMLAGWLL